MINLLLFKFLENLVIVTAKLLLASLWIIEIISQAFFPSKYNWKTLSMRTRGEKADAKNSTSHFEGMAGVPLLASADVARSGISCSKGKILVLEASLPPDP